MQNQTSSKLRFGVTIVTYNRCNLLKECIECIDNQTLPFDYICIVNNASTDGTFEYLSNLESENSKVHVIHSDTNLGGAGGFSLGIRESYDKTDYLLIIDDDAMLSPNYLEDIVASMQADIKAYSGVVETNGVIDTTHRRIMSNKTLMLKTDVPTDEYSKPFFDYELATFCGLMVSTDIIKKIGFPRDDFFIWYDDTEYSLRIGKYTKIRNINSAKINHKTKLTVDSDLTWKSYYGYRNASYVGFEYSNCKIFYKAFRYLFFIIRFIKYFIKVLSNDAKKPYYIFCKHLYLDVLKDVHKGVTGKVSKYSPDATRK